MAYDINWDKLFWELFFGNGSWFGCLLIVLICAIVLASWKWGGILCIPVSVFMGIQLLAAGLGWQGIVLAMITPLSLLRLADVLEEK